MKGEEGRKREDEKVTAERKVKASQEKKKGPSRRGGGSAARRAVGERKGAALKTLREEPETCKATADELRR